MASPKPISRAPVVSRPLPLLTCLRYSARLWLTKILIKLLFGLLHVLNFRNMSSFKPTYTKRYTIRPMLENRVFIPNEWQSGTKLPLLLNVHGGAFALMDPSIDDEICRNLANNHNICIISLNYRKAPTHQFPAAVLDVGAIAKAVLEDDDLPIDATKIAIMGFSAGGNLALAVSQLPSLYPKIRGVLTYYPLVDASLVNTGPYRMDQDGQRDVLESMADMMWYAYIPDGQNRCDLLLSPIYAERGKLPKHLFFVCAEYDYLCQEAEIVAKRLAGIGDYEADEERVVRGNREVWEKDGIKWRMVRGVQHGFTHQIYWGRKKMEMKRVNDGLWEEAALWLKEKVWT